MSTSPVPLPFLPDIVAHFKFTSPFTTQSVAYLSNSVSVIEFTALLKDVDELEALRTPYGIEYEDLIN